MGRRKITKAIFLSILTKTLILSQHKLLFNRFFNGFIIINKYLLTNACQNALVDIDLQHKMKKAIQQIILLCMLLLFSNNSLFAHTLTKKSLLEVSLKTFSKETVNQSDLENLFKNQTALSDAVFETYQKKEILSSDNEEEDSETMTSKKSIEKQSYQLSFFNQQTVSVVISFIKKTQAFCKELSYLPSCNSLYIIFEVFRI
ncbi:MAG: hypothetical protein RIR01_1743 [Bacteroidota bacterium]